MCEPPNHLHTQLDLCHNAAVDIIKDADQVHSIIQDDQLCRSIRSVAASYACEEIVDFLATVRDLRRLAAKASLCCEDNRGPVPVSGPNNDAVIDLDAITGGSGSGSASAMSPKPARKSSGKARLLGKGSLDLPRAKAGAGGGAQLPAATLADVQRAADDIERRFLCVRAPQEINLYHDHRDQIRAHLAQVRSEAEAVTARGAGPSDVARVCEQYANAFAVAEGEMQILLRFNVLPEFLARQERESAALSRRKSSAQSGKLIPKDVRCKLRQEGMIPTVLDSINVGESDESDRSADADAAAALRHPSSSSDDPPTGIVIV